MFETQEILPKNYKQAKKILVIKFFCFCKNANKHLGVKTSGCFLHRVLTKNQMCDIIHLTFRLNVK